jgi:hypothetical protein
MKTTAARIAMTITLEKDIDVPPVDNQLHLLGRMKLAIPNNYSTYFPF